MTEYIDNDNGIVKVTVIEPVKQLNYDKSHIFNVGYAERFGLNEAIILQNIIFWIEKNIANQKNQYDGYYWTYNSVKAFSEMLPYLSEKQIRTALKNLEDQGVIMTGNYNKSPYDKTTWYAIRDSSILPKGQIGDTKMSNLFTEKGEPIPDNKPYIKPDNKDILSDNSDSTPKDSAAIEVIDYLNSKTDKKYRHIKANLDIINKRLKDGYTIQDLKLVIDNKCNDWKQDEKMNAFQRPSTLFNSVKIEGYLQTTNKSKKKEGFIKNGDISVKM